MAATDLSNFGITGARESPSRILTIELIQDPELGGFTARLPNIPAYGEGETEQEANDDLKGAIHGYIEIFGLADALTQDSHPALRTIDLVELAGESFFGSEARWPHVAQRIRSPL